MMSPDGRRGGGDSLVLCYHGVSPTWPSELAVTPDALKRQLEYLAGHGYRGVTLARIVRGEVSGRAVAITFDDACRSVLELGHPILSELAFPATVFVPTAFVGQDAPMRWPGVEQWSNGPYARELLPMSWNELRALAEEGWEIGSHSHSHARLPDLSDDRLTEELDRSRAECEGALETRCRSIAYPYGAVDTRVTQAAADAGYTAGVVLARQLALESPLRFPRVGIYRADSMGRFRVKVSPAVRRIRVSLEAWSAPRGQA
jgi:peptidoglycan/xylan/chitin deacetylase (PgdA/CDA1 family)